MSGQHERQEDRTGKEERYELLNRVSNALDGPMAVLALIWVLVLLIQIVPGVPDRWRGGVAQLDLVIWAAFVIQFVLEFVIAPDKLGYLRTHWLIALSVAVPFFRVLRLVQVFRALRGLSLLRMILGVNRATRAAASIFGAHGLEYLLSVVVIVSLSGGTAVYFFERDVPTADIRTFGDAIWWASTIVTTINVSLEPVTWEGRVIGLLLRVFGLAVFGYVTASFASYFVGKRIETRQSARMEHSDSAEERRLQQRSAELERKPDDPQEERAPRRAD